MSGELRAIPSMPEVGAEARERLKELLEKIDAGEVSAVAVAVVYRDGSTDSSRSRTDNMATLIGAIARLQHRCLEA